MIEKTAKFLLLSLCLFSFQKVHAMKTSFMTGSGSSSGGGGSGYIQIQDESSNLVKRSTVNFTGTGVVCADNAGTQTTDCTMMSGSSVGDNLGNHIATMTVILSSGAISNSTVTIKNDLAASSMTWLAPNPDGTGFANMYQWNKVTNSAGNFGNFIFNISTSGYRSPALNNSGKHSVLSMGPDSLGFSFIGNNGSWSILPGEIDFDTNGTGASQLQMTPSLTTFDSDGDFFPELSLTPTGITMAPTAASPSFFMGTGGMSLGFSPLSAGVLSIKGDGSVGSSLFLQQSDFGLEDLLVFGDSTVNQISQVNHYGNWQPQAANDPIMFGNVAEGAFSTNLYASNRGAPVVFDGTQFVHLVGVSSGSVPSNGQVPVYQTSDNTINWGTTAGGGTTPGATYYIQNTITPNTTTQVFSVSGATITGRLNADNVMIISSSTFYQQRLGSSATTYYTTAVDANGSVVFDSSGTNAGFVFKDSVTVISPLVVQSVPFSNRLVISADGTNSTLAIGLGNNLVLTGPSTASETIGTTGTTITRNTADGNPTLTINNASASSTASITAFNFGGVTKSSVTPSGTLMQLGTVIASTNTAPRMVRFSFSGNGSAVTASTSCAQMNYEGTISSFSVEGDFISTGSISVDIKRSTKDLFPSGLQSIIGAGNKPTLSSASYSTATPASWTSTKLNFGDHICGTNDSSSTLTWATVNVWITP